MGTRSGLLAGVLLVVLGATASAQSSSPGPEASEAAGQQLVAPLHRVAITIPADWEIRLLENDGEPLSPSSQVYRQELVYAATPLSEPVTAVCGIWVYSTPDGSAVSLETEVEAYIEHLGDYPQSEPVSPTPEIVELPAGAAMHVVVDQLSPTSSRPDGVARTSAYFLARDDELYVTWCRRGPRDDDRWLNFAETLEFLPDEEE